MHCSPGLAFVQLSLAPTPLHPSTLGICCSTQKSAWYGTGGGLGSEMHPAPTSFPTSFIIQFWTVIKLKWLKSSYGLIHFLCSQYLVFPPIHQRGLIGTEVTVQCSAIAHLSLLLPHVCWSSWCLSVIGLHTHISQDSNLSASHPLSSILMCPYHILPSCSLFQEVLTARVWFVLLFFSANQGDQQYFMGIFYNNSRMLSEEAHDSISCFWSLVCIRSHILLY